VQQERVSNLIRNSAVMMPQRSLEMLVRSFGLAGSSGLRLSILEESNNGFPLEAPTLGILSSCTSTAAQDMFLCPLNWWFGLGWEEYFTVVHWDQRGSGKTYILNDPAKVKPTLTFERMRADVQEMISWVMKEFGKKKIFLVGHSWGSYLGIQTALHHPEFLHAYVGVSQLTNGPESERRGWSATLAAAQRDGNEEAIRALKSLEPYFAPGRPSSLQDIYSQRKWLDHYGGVMAFRKSNSAESDLSILSPDYTSADISHIWDGNEFTEEAFLAKVLATDLSGIKRIECPVVIFAGRFDTNASSEVAAEWFDKMSAPKKEFVWFENSAHLPMTEEPGKFFEVLLRVVRPIAEPAGDTPPR
jgi:proline iminopeptidase